MMPSSTPLDQRTRQQAAQRFFAKDEPRGQRHGYGHDARHDHFLQGRRGADVHAAGVLRRRLAFHQAGNFPELAAHFFNHVKRRPAYSLHRQAANKKGSMPPMNTPTITVGFIKLIVSTSAADA